MNIPQEAIEWLEDAPMEQHKGDINRANLCVAMAQAHATLARAEQQRIANLIALSAIEFPFGDGENRVRLNIGAIEFTAQDGLVHAELRPEIREALGLGDQR